MPIIYLKISVFVILLQFQNILNTINTTVYGSDESIKTIVTNEFEIKFKQLTQQNIPQQIKIPNVEWKMSTKNTQLAHVNAPSKNIVQE